MFVPNEGSTSAAETGKESQTTTTDGGFSMERLSAFEDTPTQPVQADKPTESDTEHGTFLDRIRSAKTPEEAVKLAEESMKSLQAGYTKKFQSLADEKRQLEELRSEKKGWDKARAQEVLNDPEFAAIVDELAAAQGQAIDNFEDDEFSNLTASEKKALAEAKEAKRELDRMKKEREQQSIAQGADKMHADLEAKFKGTYKREDVQSFLADVANGKRQVGFEDIYKIQNFEKISEKAYRMGLLEGQKAISTKVSGSTGTGTGAASGSTSFVADSTKSSHANALSFITGQLAKLKNT